MDVFQAVIVVLLVVLGPERTPIKRVNSRRLYENVFFRFFNLS